MENKEPNLRFEQYCIWGQPIPLARPRLCRGWIFDSQKHKKMDSYDILVAQHGNKPKFTGPVTLQVVFHMKMPATASKKKKLEMDGAPHFARPDFDNLLKYVNDVAQGILFDDDCIVAQVCGCKQYSFQPRTEITITEMR
jgi:Holliday junction resolvase RusA-like endonuclease